MVNRIDELFREKSGNILSIFFTAGYPELESTGPLIEAIEAAGADLVEIGMPYSDPLADGPTIQTSSSKALKNGMKLSLLFKQITQLRKVSKLPSLIMAYYNQLLKFGFGKFCSECKQSGIDGLIIPDLPMEYYQKEYIDVVKYNNLRISFLITPQSSYDRIILADKLSSAFVYAVSSSSVTGKKLKIEKNQTEYFSRIKNMNLKNPVLIGFGISDKESFNIACKYANGAIIGSSFIKFLSKPADIKKLVIQFVNSIKS